MTYKTEIEQVRKLLKSITNSIEDKNPDFDIWPDTYENLQQAAITLQEKLERLENKQQKQGDK